MHTRIEKEIASEKQLSTIAKTLIEARQTLSCHNPLLMRALCNEIIDGTHKKISLHELHTNFKFENEKVDKMSSAYRLKLIKNHFQVLIANENE